MKVLCIGDSLGMPRPGVSYEETWFYRLSMKYRNISFIDKFRRQMTSEALADRDFYISHYEPDAVIMQLGVCDCSPRIINDRALPWKALIAISKKIHFVTPFWKIVKSIYGRNKRDRVWVSYEIFQNNVKAFVKSMQENNERIKIVFIGIGTPSEKIQERSPYMMANIQRYNQVFRTLAESGKPDMYFVNPLDSSEEQFYIDGYHPNNRGHDLVYVALDKILSEWSKGLRL